MFSSRVYAQNLPVNWVASGQYYGGAECRNLATDNQGNVYMAGYFTSQTIQIGGTTLNANNGQAFVVKYSPDGSVLNVKQVKAINVFVSTDTLGNVFVGGTYINTASLTYGNITIYNNYNFYSSRIFIFKIDSLDNSIWGKHYGGNYDAVLDAMAADVHGNVHLAGRFICDTLHMGSIDIFKKNVKNVIVAKQDSSGKIIWAQAGGSITDGPVLDNLAADKNGNVYAAGTYSYQTKFSKKTLPQLYQNSYCLLKFDSAGELQWYITDSIGNWSNGTMALGIDGKNDVYLSGYFDNNIHIKKFFIQTNEKGNFFIFRCSSDGAVKWAKHFTTNIFGYYGCKMLVDIHSNIYIAGNLRDLNCKYISLVKFDSSFNLVRKNSYEGSSTGDYITSLAIDRSDNIFMGGKYQSCFLEFGKSIISQPNNYTADFFLVKMYGHGMDTCFENYYDRTFIYDTVTTAIKNQVKIIQHIPIKQTDTLYIYVNGNNILSPHPQNIIRIYPNPTTDIITILADGYEHLNGYTLKVVNSASQLVYQKNISEPVLTIDMAKLGRKGTYFLLFHAPGGSLVETRKIVLE